MTNEELKMLLSLLKENARGIKHTRIRNVKKENFVWIIDEAIKALEQQRNLTNEELYQSFIKLEAENERLHDALESQRWIPVTERLPKAGEYIGDVERYYLVQNEYGDMLVARYTHGEYWEQIYQLKPIGDEIIAWMPLPEPYKAESEDV